MNVFELENGSLYTSYSLTGAWIRALYKGEDKLFTKSIIWKILLAGEYLMKSKHDEIKMNLKNKQAIAVHIIHSTFGAMNVDFYFKLERDIVLFEGYKVTNTNYFWSRGNG